MNEKDLEALAEKFFQANEKLLSQLSKPEACNHPSVPENAHCWLVTCQRCGVLYPMPTVAEDLEKERAKVAALKEGFHAVLDSITSVMAALITLHIKSK